MPVHRCRWHPRRDITVYIYSLSFACESSIFSSFIFLSYNTWKRTADSPGGWSQSNCAFLELSQMLLELPRADRHHLRTAVPRVLPSDFVLAVPHRDSDGQCPLSPAADNQNLHPWGWPTGYWVQDPGQVQRWEWILDIETSFSIFSCPRQGRAAPRPLLLSHIIVPPLIPKIICLQCCPLLLLWICFPYSKQALSTKRLEVKCWGFL